AAGVGKGCGSAPDGRWGHGAQERDVVVIFGGREGIVGALDLDPLAAGHPLMLNPRHTVSTPVDVGRGGLVVLIEGVAGVAARVDRESQRVLGQLAHVLLERAQWNDGT